jgi:hypothetical protein
MLKSGATVPQPAPQRPAFIQEPFNYTSCFARLEYFRTTTLMKDGHDNDSIATCVEKQSVRKSMKEDPPECSLNDLER